MAHVWKTDHRFGIPGRTCQLCMKRQQYLLKSYDRMTGSTYGWTPTVGHCLSMQELRFNAVSTASFAVMHAGNDILATDAAEAITALELRLQATPESAAAEWFRRRSPAQNRMFEKEWQARQQAVERMRKNDPYR